MTSAEDMMKKWRQRSDLPDILLRPGVGGKVEIHHEIGGRDVSLGGFQMMGIWVTSVRELSRF